MVAAPELRLDVDEELLTKVITYRKYDYQTIRDLATDEHNIDTSYTDYQIKAQCTIQSFDSKFVQDGIAIEGDLVGLFRFKYDKDSDGDIITPELIPQTKDKIKFLGQWYSVKQCTPATLEDSGIIGWDFTAGQTTLDEFELN